MTLVNTSSRARLKRLTSRWGTPWRLQKPSRSVATRGRAAKSLATFSFSRSSATPLSMLEAEADALPPARGVGRKLARQAAQDHPRQAGELAVVGQQLVVVRRRGQRDERLALVFRRHLEPVLVEGHGEVGAGARLDQQLERLDGLEHRPARPLDDIAAGAPDATLRVGEV